MFEFSEDVKKKVYETLGRNEQMVESDVKIMKAWMNTQAHLPEIMEDVKIRNFLTLNKFNIEKTKERIDMYYTIRSIIPDFFEINYQKCDNFESVFDNTYLFTFPKLVNETHRVYYMKPKKPDTFNVTKMSTFWFRIFEIRLSEDFMVDDIIILDFENLSLVDIKTVTPEIVTKFLAVYKNVYSLRLDKFILVNCPPYISLLVAVLKSVLKPKLFDIGEFHADAAVLQNIFPKNELPKEYGGEGASLDQMNDMMKKKFLEYQHRFDQLYKLRVNENLRSEKLRDNILGFYGDFKKINVD